MTTLRIGPGVPQPRRQRSDLLVEAAGLLARGLLVGLGIGLGVTVWVFAASLF